MVGLLEVADAAVTDSGLGVKLLIME